MTADALLSRLEKVKKTGASRWVACCPAHADRSPSLAIRELDNGLVLVHCFAGCGVDAILAAVGLELSELYPEKLPSTEGEPVRQKRERFHAADVLAALAQEALVVDVAAGMIQRRGYLNDAEADRLALASDRIMGGLAYAARHV